MANPETERPRRQSAGLWSFTLRKAGEGTQEWLAALDNRTRKAHAAHGQVVAQDANFEVGGDRVPAPWQTGIAAEEIQCRWSMLAVSAPSRELVAHAATGGGVE